MDEREEEFDFGIKGPKLDLKDEGGHGMEGITRS